MWRLREHDRRSTVTLTSDVPLAAAKASSIVARLKRAMRFDLDALGWSPEVSRGQLHVRLSRHMEPGSAVAANRRMIRASTSVLKGERGYDDNLFAHEIGHVLQYRVGGTAAWREIPTFIQEGLACVVGD